MRRASPLRPAGPVTEWIADHDTAYSLYVFTGGIDGLLHPWRSQTHESQGGTQKAVVLTASSAGLGSSGLYHQGFHHGPGHFGHRYPEIHHAAYRWEHGCHPSAITSSKKNSPR